MDLSDQKAESKDTKSDDSTSKATLTGADQKSTIPIPDVSLQMKIANVGINLPDSYPKVTLEEILPPHRRLTIRTGAMEGIAVSYAQNKIQTRRPLTHILILDILNNFSLTLERVLITKAIGELFLTEIVISGPKGQKRIDARPSDALAIALYHTPEVPIMVSEEVLASRGY